MRKNVLVTGAFSMIGRQVVNKLVGKYDSIYDPSKQALDLLDYKEVREYFNIYRPKEVIMLAGYNGSLSFNKKYPFDISCNSSLMSLNTLKACVEFGVNKVVFSIPSCALQPSDDMSIECDLFSGEPHESVACHGLSKRYVYNCGQFARRQYGLNFVGVIGQNSFGPGDRFDERGKVVSGMIDRMYKAFKSNDPTFTVYGDGTVLREFLYCKDFAEGIVQVLQSYNEIFPVNLTSGYEISIGDLAKKIKDIIGYQGSLVLTGPQDNGQMRKRMSKERMYKYLDINFTSFDVALKETVEWYIKNAN